MFGVEEVTSCKNAQIERWGPLDDRGFPPEDLLAAGSVGALGESNAMGRRIWPQHRRVHALQGPPGLERDAPRLSHFRFELLTAADLPTVDRFFS